MLTPTEAARLILEHIAPLPGARRPLREALDRVLAEDGTSPIDLPAWDNSAMDGYAARAADVASADPDHKVTRAVVEAGPAGQFPTKPIGPGQVTRIFTGAPLPAGADTVVRQEDTEPAERGSITVVTGRDARKNVRHRGEDIRKGEVVLGAGTPLGPAQLGVLASIAHATPLVYDAPPRRLHGLGRRDRGPGPCGRYPVGQEDRDFKLLHAARTDQAERRDPGGPGPGARYEGKPARPFRRGAAGLGPARDNRRGQRGGARLCARGPDRAGGRDQAVAHRHAPRRPGRIRPAGRNAMDRAAGQSGERDGHLRAVRAPGHPPHAGPPAPVPPDRARLRG